MRQSNNIYIETRDDENGCVTLSELAVPWRGFTHRAEGCDPSGVYLSVVAHSAEDAYSKWLQKIPEAGKMEAQRLAKFDSDSRNARQERGRPQFFNGRKVQ